ncbi:MAG: ATP-binding protein, partial [Candidatus Zixiibacteriota bacterium]
LDSAVNIFEQVIRELKQKEKTLQVLYQQTDRKAKDLASYNEYILKSMTSGMVICNEHGEIVQINQPAEAILGISKSFVMGKRYKVAFREKDPLCTAIGTTLGEQKAYSIPEVEITAGNGESAWISINSTVIKDEQDRMLGVVVFLNDFTEIKKLEQEIAFKDKMASLGEMSSGLAHELRNSMGAIIGFAKLLLKRKGDPNLQSQAVDSIVKEAMTMETMLKSFLAFAKPLSLKIEEISLRDIFEECYISVKETLKENRIAFKVDSDPELPPMWGDRILLKQCLQNLIQNSIDAMPRGGELNIRLEEKQQGTKERLFTVEISDTGYGIPKEIQEKVFHPFFTSKEKGTGLGLSIVKKIVSLHHGKIELESQPNQGTTFYISLPLKPPLQKPSDEVVEKVNTKPQLQEY